MTSIWSARLAGTALVAALASSFVVGAGEQQQAPMPSDMQRALDKIPPALRYVEGDACCGEPYDIAGRPTNRYQLFVTGAPIDVQLPQSSGAATLSHEEPRFVLAAFQKPGSGATVMPAGLSVTLVATGAATSEAFRLQVVVSAGAHGRLIAPDALALEPLSTRPSSSTPGPQTVLGTISAYSAEFSKDPPPAGTLYRVADAQRQERLKAMRYLLRAADGLAAARRLHPDAAPAEYLEFVKQWSIWTRLENWDLKEFGDELIARAKKDVERARQPWTRDVEQRIRALVPGRWGDVQTVMTTAEILTNTSAR